MPENEKIKKSDLIGDINVENEISALNKMLGVVSMLQEKVKELSKTKLSEVVKIDVSSTKGLSDLNKARKDANKLKNESVLLDKEQKKLKKQLFEATDEQVKGKIRLQKVNSAQKKELTDLLILENKESGTLEKLAASSRRLRREREKLNLDTDKGIRRLQEINKQLDLNNQKITNNSDKLKKQRLNVGNYSNSVKDAISQSGLFSRQLIVLTRIQGTLNALLKKNKTETEANAVAQVAASKASGGFTKSLKVLKVALISTGIGAIVVALGSLIAAFASTQRGADAFTRVMRPLQTIFERFIGFLQDTSFSVLDRLKQAFEDPKQAVIDLANAIKVNLIARFEGIAVFGGAIAKLFKGEFKDGFEELTNASIQTATGIKDATEKMREFSEETNNAVSESIRQGEELDKLIKAFERLQIEATVPLAEARLEFQRLRAIANDQTKSDQERIDALKEAEEQQRLIAKTEKELLDLQISKIELQQSFNDTNREEELELEQLRAQRLQAEATAQKKINGILSLRTGIEKRINTKQEKRAESLEKEEEKAREKAKKKEEEEEKKRKERARENRKEIQKEIIRSIEET